MVALHLDDVKCPSDHLVRKIEKQVDKEFPPKSSPIPSEKAGSIPTLDTASSETPMSQTRGAPDDATADQKAEHCSGKKRLAQLSPSVPNGAAV